MKQSNIFKEIPKQLQDELFEDIITTEKLKIQRIVSYGHTSPKSGWYKQDTNEWVILLKGEAILSFEKREDIRLKSGDYINILALEKHKVSWTKPDEESVWLAIHY